MERSPNYDQLSLQRHYDLDDHHAWKVRARFEVYNYAEPHVDFEELVVNSLELAGTTKNIVDVGAADASYLYRLWLEFGIRGNLVGIEPHTSQFEHIEKMDSLDMVGLIKKALDALYPYENNFGESAKIDAITNNVPNIQLFSDRATDLAHVKDSFADLVFAMFMLYHLNEAERVQAYDEFKRVLKPDGIFVLATSGDENKSQHRLLEKLIAVKLGGNTEAPLPMNAGFTSEKAKREILQHFHRAYILEQRSPILINSEEGVDTYKLSLLSLRDQFNPVPDVSTFTAAMNNILNLYLVQHAGHIVDLACRSVVIASNADINESRLKEFGFKELGRDS